MPKPFIDPDPTTQTRPLTAREVFAATVLLIQVGVPPERLRMSRTRIIEVDPATGEPAGEVRACRDDPDWLRLLGCSGRRLRFRATPRGISWHPEDARLPENLAGPAGPLLAGR